MTDETPLTKARAAKAEKKRKAEERIAELERQITALTGRQAQDMEAPPSVPYRGFVKALQDCFYRDAYYVGPTPDKGIAASVFEVDLPALWSDDPFVPVIVTGTKDDGSLITVPNPSAVILDRRWRRLNTDVFNPQARAM